MLTSRYSVLFVFKVKTKLSLSYLNSTVIHSILITLYIGLQQLIVHIKQTEEKDLTCSVGHRNVNPVALFMI